MVNPLIYPEQRRPQAGPFAAPAGGGNFEPFDNEIYFDPDYVGGVENGSIAGPFIAWDDWVAAVGANAWRVMFPGVEVTAGSDSIPLTDGNALVIEGVKSSILGGSHIAGSMLVNNPATDGASLHFKYLSFELLETNGGDYDLTFTDCEVGDLLEAGGDYTGTLYGFNNHFSVLTLLGSATARLTGGSVLSLELDTIYLTDLYVGSVDGVSSGVLTAQGTLISCKGVIFNPGSTITFGGVAGELFLDGPSYKSFLDNDIVLTNGHVTRDDGSWPVDAISYASVAGAGETINFTKNPRAILEYDSDFTCQFDPPLTREVQILLINTDTGGPISWPANVFWSDGEPPDFPITAGAETLLRFDYEESLDTYYGWVALMDAQAEP